MAPLSLRLLPFFLILLASRVVPAGAQQQSDPLDAVYVPVNISVFPGLSIADAVTSATGSPTINKFSYNIFAGRSYALEGVEFGSLWNAETGYVRGAQFAGLANTVGGDVHGVQFAGLANIAAGPLNGGQFGGLASLAGEDARGIQAGGIVSIAGGDMRGVQAGGIAAMAEGALDGAQFAGIVSMAGESADAQFSGVVSMAGGDVSAIQASGVASLAGASVTGLQIAGVVNMASDRVTGAQIAGLINMAPRVSGLQLGVVNVSQRHSGVPIGLLSYVRETGLRYDLWADESGMITTAVRSGNDVVSNYLGAGVIAGTSDFRFASVAGLGIESDLSRTLFGTVDAITHTLHDDSFTSWANLSKFRLMMGFRLAPGVAFMAGPTMNVYVSTDDDGSDLAPWSVYETQSSDAFVRMWPGFNAGFRFAPRGM